MSNTSFPTMRGSRSTRITSMEFSMELSSEVPGTSADWPSDITISVNGKDIGTWMSPGRFRRQARRLHARLVEAQGQPVRQAQGLPRQRRRHLCRRRQDFAGVAQGPRPRHPPLDPAADRRSRRTPSIRAASTFSAAASAITTRTSCCGSRPTERDPLALDASLDARDLYHIKVSDINQKNGSGRAGDARDSYCA